MQLRIQPFTHAHTYCQNVTVRSHTWRPSSLDDQSHTPHTHTHTRTHKHTHSLYGMSEIIMGAVCFVAQWLACWTANRSGFKSQPGQKFGSRFHLQLRPL